MSAPTLAELLAQVKAYLEANLPGCMPDELIVKMVRGPAFRAPIGGIVLPAPQPAAAPPPTYQASPDLRSLNWYGTAYSFTATQAACMRVLLEAYENGTPDVDQATILERADSDCNRLRDLFRNGAGLTAWGVLIVPGTTSGTFRLSEP